MKKKILPIIIFILLLIGMAIFPLIPLKIFNINIENFNQNMKILYNFICDISYMAIIFLIYRKIIIDDFYKYINNFKNNFEKSFKYYLIGLSIMIISNILIGLFFNEASANNEEAVRNLLNLYPIYMIFSVSIYAPFVEEMIFRKSIYDSIFILKDNKITKYLYVFISGLVFSSLHIIGVSSKLIDYVYIIPYLALGSAFALLYYDSKNVFSSIVMHSMHNTVAVILYLVVGVI